MESDFQTQALKEMLVGRTITDVSSKTSRNGDYYQVLLFDDGSFYEYLAAFTVLDHQVARATELGEQIAAREDLQPEEKVDLIVKTLMGNSLEAIANRLEAIKNG